MKDSKQVVSNVKLVIKVGVKQALLQVKDSKQAVSKLKLVIKVGFIKSKTSFITSKR